MNPGMAIDASRDGDRYIPGWRSMYPGMVIIASRDGDLEMTVDASRDQWRLQYPWIAIVFIPGWLLGWRSPHPWMAIDASRDGDR